MLSQAIIVLAINRSQLVQHANVGKQKKRRVGQIMNDFDFAPDCIGFDGKFSNLTGWSILFLFCFFVFAKQTMKQQSKT